MKYYVYVSVDADCERVWEDIFTDNDLDLEHYHKIAKCHIENDIELFLKFQDVPAQQYIVNIVVVPADDCKQYCTVYKLNNFKTGTYEKK